MAIRGVSYRAVLLDALGTLVELEPPAPRLAAELGERFGLAVSRAQSEQAIAAEIAYYRSHLDEARDEAGLTALRARCAQVLAAELRRVLARDVPSGQAMVDALLASLVFAPFADAASALSRLHGLGLRLVVVSNWDVSLPGVLDRLGLSVWLDGVVTSAEVGSGKPAATIFQRALAMAGVGAGEALHVGDSFREDVEGARAAGIEPVLIRRGERAPPPASGFTTIASLHELPPLVSSRDG